MLTHQPIHSSPLAESSRSSPVTPVITAQRRRSGYKASFPSVGPSNGNGSDFFGMTDEPQKVFLRERFKARCFERAKKDRERARRRVSGSRSSDGSISGGSSDGDAEMDSDGEGEDEDTVMQDEVRFHSLYHCILNLCCLVSFSFTRSANLLFTNGTTTPLAALS